MVAGTMVRAKQSIDINLALTALDANSAYSAWYIVFNNPENCIDPVPGTGGTCGENDVPDSVFYAAGFVTGGNGNANISAHLDAGKLPVGAQVLKPGTLNRGNGFGAEIHMVIRSHGTVIPGSMAEQIGSVEGGCDFNVCADQAAIIFPPT